MINILIKDDDIFYIKGLSYFLADVFQREIQGVNFLSGFNAKNIQLADIIILSFCQGERGICFPELRLRKQGIVIGLVDKQSEVHDLLPSCYQDIVFISRRSSLEQMQNVILDTWLHYQRGGILNINNDCNLCQNKILSPQQMKVMAFIYKGKTVSEIASNLMISDSTVFSHKYLMMKKFNLHSDYELLTFLNRLATKDLNPNYFREYIES